MKHLLALGVSLFLLSACSQGQSSQAPLSQAAKSLASQQSQPAADQSKTSSETAISSQDQGSSSAMPQSQENKTPEQVAEEEGNHAEQVVVQITADGYVTSHGDHYHFYNGQVGYEALFSRDLVLGEDYQFDPSHVVTEVADGYVVRQGEAYGLYLTASEPTSLRD